MGRSVSQTEPAWDPVVEAYKKGLDLTLIERNLRLSPHERILQLIEMQRFAHELRRGCSKAQGTP